MRLLVGDTTIGELTEIGRDPEWLRCTFVPTDAYPRYAAWFTETDLSEVEDDALDDVVDEIAVLGVFVEHPEWTLVDPTIIISGDRAIIGLD